MRVESASDLAPEPATAGVTARRAVLKGASAVGLGAVLVACSGDETPDTESTANNPAESPTSDGSPTGGGDGGGVLAKTSDIPVGGGKVFPDRKVVITQPTEGDYKAFDTTCTHKGCTVKDVANGVIVCPCHNSHFAITDGSVKAGPATKPLPSKAIAVNGQDITLA